MWRTLAAAAALAGCPENLMGENIAACERFLDATTCGDFDLRETVDCAVYADPSYESCDIRPYFTCLIEHTTCDEATGAIDTSGWIHCIERAECD